MLGSVVRPRFYRLAGREAVPIDGEDMMEFAAVMTSGRTVGKTELPGNTTVSTVFLGLDHQFAPDGPPLLFETMVFSDDDTYERQIRYTTYDEAEVGHAAIVGDLLRRMAEAVLLPLPTPPPLPLPVFPDNHRAGLDL